MPAWHFLLAGLIQRRQSETLHLLVLRCKMLLFSSQLKDENYWFYQ